MKELSILLGRADFSRGTDLKARLRSRLFGAVVQFPGSRVVLEEELELVNAAGDPLSAAGMQAADEQI